MMAQSHQYYYEPEVSKSDLLDRAENIVDDFLMFIRRESAWNDIFDETVLPVPKLTLVNAFRFVIESENRADYRRTLAKAGMMLSRFQQGIGQRMSLLPVDDNEPKNDPAPDVTMAQHLEYIEHFDRAYALIEADSKKLSAIFDHSMLVAERREAKMSAQREQAAAFCRPTVHH